MFSYFYYQAYQLRPSKKIPKWCPMDEVKKTWTTNSTKQVDLEEAANQGNDMDVSFDCELNLYVNFELSPFIEVDAFNEWKKDIQNEYDALIKNRRIERGRWFTV